MYIYIIFLIIVRYSRCIILLLCVYSLYQKIDTEKLQCLNEAEDGSGKAVFKPWDERLDRTKVCVCIESMVNV